ncbi:MAG TPA: NAD(P)H-hydrate dehydratase, partial [Methylomirabilota bacterium]|nr:NAD(P)H-hydrate dehydratase [Methylomirabilota bacterium]
EQMRRVDQRAIRELGIPGATLMENAGRGAAERLLAARAALGLPRRGGRVAIVCGKGGNGGDGFVVARWLKRAGHRPDVLLLARPDELHGDAALKHREMERRGIRTRVVEDAGALTRALAGAHVVVDAILGTGARGAPAPLAAAAIERINACGRPVVALDIPSGLPADGAPPAGPVIRAALTPTFAGIKRGLVAGPGVALAGRVEVVDIGIPPAEVARGIDTFVLQRGDVARHFPPRQRDAPKGDYGHLLIVAGSVGKTGAAALAARAALRAGAGLVSVATAAGAQPTVAALVLEAMTEPAPETSAHSLSLKARELLEELAARRDAVALGPGLGLDEDTQALARALVLECARPFAVDADALTALAGHLERLRGAPAPRCLTPHPGEMARMLGVSVAEVQRDRIATVRQFATAWGVHVVLKGSTSVLGRPDGTVLLNPTGNPGMASGGTGDVLTGVLGAFLARGLAPADALACAVYLHGAAGDIAAARVGQESLIAGDVIEALPAAFASLAGAGD